MGIAIKPSPRGGEGYAALSAKRLRRSWKRGVCPRGGSLPPPKHILNAPTGLMKDQGYGAEYAYDHHAPDGFSGQDYFPVEFGRLRFYEPVERGFERDLIKRIAYFDKLRARRRDDR